MSKIAVIILNYNGKNYLEQFLPSVIEHSQYAEIIVADNASTDDSIPFLQQHHPDLRQIVLDQNYGFAGGYNKALEQVSADYFVLLNSDVEVTTGWLDPMVSFLEKNPDYAACQPKILDFNRKDHFEYAGAAGGYVDVLGYPFCRGRVFDTIEKDEGQYNDEADVFWATGACFTIRSDLFTAIGGFDKDFFAHMEEIDLCWRLLNHGHKIRYIPDSKVYHVGGGTLSQSSAFKTYLNFRNSFYVLIKNIPLLQLSWKLPLRWMMDWLAVFRFVLSGEFHHAKGIIRAHGSVIKNFRKVFNKRNRTDVRHLSRFSIVFKYFVSGKKTYSTL
ncbi:MAG: glycosyltransferase family 2 protein [Bacteroidota bacterium]